MVLQASHHEHEVPKGHMIKPLFPVWVIRVVTNPTIIVTILIT